MGLYHIVADRCKITKSLFDHKWSTIYSFMLYQQNLSDLIKTCVKYVCKKLNIFAKTWNIFATYWLTDLSVSDHIITSQRSISLQMNTPTLKQGWSQTILVPNPSYLHVAHTRYRSCHPPFGWWGFKTLCPCNSLVNKIQQNVSLPFLT